MSEEVTVDSPTPNSYVVGVEIVEGTGAATPAEPAAEQEAEPEPEAEAEG